MVLKKSQWVSNLRQLAQHNPLTNLLNKTYNQLSFTQVRSNDSQKHQMLNSVVEYNKSK